MKKGSRIYRVFLVVLFILFLNGCADSNLANRDILERIEESESPKIVWGVKADTNLFGLYNIQDVEIQGFDIDIAKAITEVITGDAANAEFVEVTSKTRIPLIKNGNIDTIIATMTISEERRKEVDFSEVYFAAGQSLLVRNDSEINSVTDLTGEHTVIAVKGSTSAINIREHSPEAEIIELENYSEAFTALQSGQGDAVTTDNAILLGMIADNPNYRLAGDPFTNEPYGIAINHGQEAFLDSVNDALATMVENGTYAEIFHHWFPTEELPDLGWAVPVEK
ncbi:transporter substrate-binding domain-containing protein [Jeotgalibaca ciconiae]|uniref:Transporter substrate-binding domain-containing protein n=1 Tax=Jeotgalibaca ciconiae TaxID=2496265 RepID=A0A3Q9BJY3_9LACT|nr:transporter substrate-binding domain-containing protein [Jeotgalibaca ciconiae]AZP04079.1 transporter substrate-binding domain-containing protein [Jeotgalibaca ciconiae]HJB22966.1 transporter substrate-binding domain-containing protein [Candidatus Jeotgalibaca pullicola]